MSDKLPDDEVVKEDELSPDESKRDAATPQRILLVPFPKVIFLYPSLLVALVAAIWQSVAGPENPFGVMLSAVFLTVLGLNLVVLSFDFPRATSLTLFFCIAAVILGGVLVFSNFPDVLPAVTDVLKNIRPIANSTFYWCYVFILVGIYLVVMISVRFDYWEVRPNELLHHHGILSDLKRFSAPNLRVDKEINDVFEYMLLRSGRLILQPSNERRAIILDNVLFINTKEQNITRMLGALQVQVREEG